MKEFLNRKVKEIQELQEIKEVYWMQKGYSDEPNTLRLGIKDVNEKEVLIPFPKEMMLSPVMNVLIVVILSKASEEGIVFLPWDSSDLVDAINEARKKYPYIGETWVNEAQARMCDCIEPIYKF